MFWGIEMKPAVTYTQSPEVPTKLSQACMDAEAEDGARATVYLRMDGDGALALCTLIKGVHESQTLDVMFGADIPVTFTVVGNATVHVSGYVMVDEMEQPMYLSEEQMAEMYGDDEDEDDDDMDEETRANTLMNAMFAGRGGAGDDDDDDDDDEDNEYVPSPSQEGDHDLPYGDDDDDDEEDELDEEELAALAAQMKRKRRMEAAEEAASKKKAKKLSGEAAPKEQKKDKKKKDKKAKTKVVTLKNGLKYYEVAEGSGKEAKPGRSVTVKYIGKLESGKKFDSSKSFKFKLGSGEVIQGWDIGVKGMRVGGKRTLVIPARLGYGSERSGPIPPNSTLVFDIVLKNVQ